MDVIPLMEPDLGDAEAEAAAEAVRSRWVAQGPRVEAFESALCAATGATHAVATSSCTTALHLALLLAGVGPGDEVVVPSLSFIATAAVVRHVGATPVFADIDPTTLNITAETFAACITPITRAVILVHQAGTPADVTTIRAMCESRSIELIEDAACAIGAMHRKEAIGARSRLAALSFHARKVITTGEGGALLTSDADLAARARRLREHGMSLSALERHRSDRPLAEQYLDVGFNYRMTDIQAAVGLVQVGRLDEIVGRRRSLAAAYQERLAALGVDLMITDPPDGLTTFQSFWVELPERGLRDGVLGALSAAGVNAKRGIMAIHHEPAFADVAHGPLPVTDRMTSSTILLPLYHRLSESDQDRVVTSLAAALGRRER